MQKINSEASLRAAIIELESKLANDGKLLKEQFQKSYESIKPVNLIKSSLKDAAASWNSGDQSLKSVTGLLSNIALELLTSTPIKGLIGKALINGVTALIEKNPETLNSLGQGLLKAIRSIFSKKKNESEVDSDSDEIFI